MCADPLEGIRAGPPGKPHQTQGRLEDDGQSLPEELPPNPGECTASGHRAEMS